MASVPEPQKAYVRFEVQLSASRQNLDIAVQIEWVGPYLIGGDTTSFSVAHGTLPALINSGVITQVISRAAEKGITVLATNVHMMESIV